MSRSITIYTNDSADTLDPSGQCTREELADLRDRYETAVTEAIRAIYPDSEIEIVSQPGLLHTRITVSGYEGQEAEIERAVSEIKSSVWDRQAF